MISPFFKRHRLVILYGIALAVLLLILKWLEWRFIIFDHAFEIYSGAIAILFTGLGIWLALRLARPQPGRPNPTTISPTVPPVTTPVTPPISETPGLGLSTRELEVLQLMAEGLSNQEIAARLYVSINTIKTHSSNIFEKMDVRRRTQAIDKAKKLNIIR